MKPATTETRRAEPSYSIGDQSLRSGLSVLRIRAWETRHGVPRSVRTDSGHRRYPAAEALRLDLLAQAVRAGARIGELSELDIDALSRVVPGSIDPPRPDPGPDRWIAWVREGRERELRDDMVRLWERLGWRTFVEAYAVPFLERVGEAWETGELGIAQEHFGSGVLHNFLEERWRRLNAAIPGKPLLLAMLPGDSHSFGLHLCALACVHARRRVLWLGPGTPAATVLSAVAGWESSGLCLSLSVTARWEEAREFLRELRRESGAAFPFYAGGAGMRGRIRGIQTFANLGDFHDHLVACR
jgi:hypothetical protein